MNENVNADLNPVRTLIDKGQFEKAKDTLEQLAINDPGSAAVWKYLGVVEHKLENHGQAEKHLTHSIKLDETDVDANCSLGGVYVSLGEFDKATAFFEKGLQLSGNRNTFALLNFLAIKGREGPLDEVLLRYEEALDWGESSCREDIDVGQNLPWACFDLAQIYFFRGEMELCREAVTQGVRVANGAWQLEAAILTYRLLAQSPDVGTRASAVEIVLLIDSLESEYFAEPDRKRCFVIMPFGSKLDSKGVEVDFDEVYEKFIKPSVEAEGLECIRCDEVDEAGNIHKKMFELLWHADVALADVSIPNPNVFYELGIRHALRKAVTVIIRNKNATLPFNIANLNAVEYTDSEGDGEARARIRKAIAKGLREGESDSHVNEILGLSISDRPRVIGSCDVYSYPINGCAKKLSLITGDLRDLRGIDVWVNSENTNMQMARYFDFSISSVIRFEGAEKTRIGHVSKDVIQDELVEILDGERSAPDAAVIATGSGELKEKCGVKAIFHAAAVRGAVGEGYQPVPNIHRCVINALQLMEDPKRNGTGTRLSSILIPLMGIGVMRGDFRPLLERQLEAALEYLIENPSSEIENVYFLAWSEQELALCQSVLRSFDKLGAPVRVKQNP